MTAEETDKLFQLLEIYFPNSPKVKSKKLKSAWLLVLEPYEPDEVKRALIEQLRESRFFPDPQAVAVRCKLPSLVEQPEPADSVQEDYSREFNAMMAWLGPWHEEWTKKLHSLGLPTLGEARSAGMSVPEWNKLLDKSGVWTL